MALTSTQQRNAVSEGMALGLLMCGQNEVASDKVAVDLAFTGAWRGWGPRTRFPQVSTDLAPSSAGLRAITRATFRKHTFNLYWDTSGPTLQIFARPQWTNTDLDFDVIALTIDGDVSAAEWHALGTEFLMRLS